MMTDELLKLVSRYSIAGEKEKYHGCKTMRPQFYLGTGGNGLVLVVKAETVWFDRRSSLQNGLGVVQ